VSLCHHRVLSHQDYGYVIVLNYVKLHTLSARMWYLDIFFDAWFNGSKYCPAILETAGLRRPNRISRNCRLFNAGFESRICLSARFASAENVIDSDNDIFNGRSVTVSIVNYYLILLLLNFINCLNF